MVCKCPKCGFSIDVSTVLPAIENYLEAMDHIGCGEPYVRCPNCQEYFAYKPVKEHAKE